MKLDKGHGRLTLTKKYAFFWSHTFIPPPCNSEILPIAPVIRTSSLGYAHGPRLTHNYWAFDLRRW